MTDAATASNCNACGVVLAGDEKEITGIDRLHGLPGTYHVIVCRHCGSGTTTPFVASADLHSLYPTDYNAYALPDSRVLSTLATGLFHWRYSRALRRHPLQGADRRYSRILDVGGGRGDLALILSRHGAQVAVMDPSETACATARSRGLHAINGTLESTPPPRSERFDALVFQHSLEHVISPAETLAAAREFLNANGSLLITVPNFGSQQRRRFGTHWFHLDLPRHRTHFTEVGLQRALTAAGFRSVELSTSTSPDGFAMSEYYCRSGQAPRTTTWRLATAGGGIATSPLVSVATGDGDILHATCSLST